MGINFKEIFEIAKMTLRMGADNIYFQPIVPPFESNWSENQLKSSFLWPVLSSEEIKHEFNKLIEFKYKRGFILNSQTHLKNMMDYLLGNPVFSKKPYCDIDLTTLFFEPRGAIRFCGFYQPIGDIKELESIKLPQLLKRSNVSKLRMTMRKCNKNCLVTCLSEKSFKDYLNIFSVLTGWATKFK